MPVNELINPRSQGLKKLMIDPHALDQVEAAKMLSENPKTMYRPLLSNGQALVVGFQPEEMERLL